MEKLSERLVNIAADNFDLEDQQPLLRAATVCAAVEAFQAAEQAMRAAPPYDSRGLNCEREAAQKTLDEAEARLLEVNLGE